MASRNYQFRFHVVELFKEDTLGTGSYGGVCRAKCDGLLCAAKIVHPMLFDLRDPGTVSYLERFEEECRLLRSASHPNVVQYLGTYCDPETHLPVLLMELCDESLCKFLEHSPEPVAYHIQLNIAHDIALALVYLHLNGVIHRDLTGNNVLLIAGTRAKVTDFGMSRLIGVNPRMTPMTQCPGNVCYMSPEALEEPPSYTTKLDVFSFGVLLVQITTRQFPDPGPRFKFITTPGCPNIREPTPEAERRASHLQLIEDTHPLKAIAIHCLKGKERERPTAQQLNDMLSEMKQAVEYTESLQQMQTGVWGEGVVARFRGQIQGIQQSSSTQQEEIQQMIEQLQRKIEQLQVEMTASAVNITTLRWAEGNKAPEEMERGSEVATGNTVYLSPLNSHKVYSCQVVSSQEQHWSTLPDHQYINSGFVVIGGVITSVGGRRDISDKTYTNSLFSLTGSGGGRRWSEVFPVMPTPRSSTVSLSTQHTLIVAGGYNGKDNLDIVEVMDILTRQWSTASPLPHSFGLASGTICGDKLYLAGGFVRYGEASKSVVMCSVTDLLSPPSLGARLHPLSQANTGVWQRARELPVTLSTVVTLGGHLLAIGGWGASTPATNAVHCYDTSTDSWRVVSEMNNPRARCLAAALSGNRLLVIGDWPANSTVETAEIGHSQIQ